MYIDRQMIKITGYISESDNYKLDKCARINAKKKMLFIGEIVSKYLQEVENETSSETSIKKNSTKIKKEVN